MKILLIDDSLEDRTLIKQQLKNINSINIEIQEANKIKEAYNKIKENIFDVIFLDLFLPESDGTDTIVNILNFLDSINKQIPLVAITGTNDYSVGLQAFNLGIKDLIYKDEVHSKELERVLRFATYNKNIRKKIRQQ